MAGCHYILTALINDKSKLLQILRIQEKILQYVIADEVKLPYYMMRSKLWGKKRFFV